MLGTQVGILRCLLTLSILPPPKTDVTPQTSFETLHLYFAEPGEGRIRNWDPVLEVRMEIGKLSGKQMVGKRNSWIRFWQSRETERVERRAEKSRRAIEKESRE